MNSPLMRNIVAVFGGLIVALLVIMIVEAIGRASFPPPPGLGPAGAGSQARLMELMPIEAKIAVAAGWFLGALAGACTAIAVSNRVFPAWAVGLVIALLGVWTTRMFPHPDWMLAASAVLPLVAVLAAKRLMARHVVSA